jgi:hypothetical protein
MSKESKLAKEMEKDLKGSISSNPHWNGIAAISRRLISYGWKKDTRQQPQSTEER